VGCFRGVNCDFLLRLGGKNASFILLLLLSDADGYCAHACHCQPALPAGKI
jgi:hypothetical protein